MISDVTREREHLFLGTRLKRLAEQMQGDVTELAQQAGIPVQPGQYPLLATIEASGPQTVSALARALGMSQPAATKAVERLRRDRARRGGADPRDGRQRPVALTTAGRNVLDRSRREFGPSSRRRSGRPSAISPAPCSSRSRDRGPPRGAAAEPPGGRCRGPPGPGGPGGPARGGGADEPGLPRAGCGLDQRGGVSRRRPDERRHAGRRPRRQPGGTAHALAGRGLGACAAASGWSRKRRGAGISARSPSTPERRMPGTGGSSSRRRRTGSAPGGRSVRMTVVNVRDTLIAWYERRGYARTGATEPFPYEDARFGVPRRADLAFVELRDRSLTVKSRLKSGKPLSSHFPATTNPGKHWQNRSSTPSRTLPPDPARIPARKPGLRKKAGAS